MLETIFPLLRCTSCHKPICLTLVKAYDAERENSSEPVNIIFGVAQCECREYPIVQGILYTLDLNREVAVRLIKEGKLSKSVDLLLGLPKGVAKIVKLLKPWGRIDTFLLKFGLGTEKLFFEPSWVLLLMELIKNSKPWSKYLNKRLNNPTFIHSLIGLNFSKRGYSLDLGSGMGHFLPYLSKLIRRDKIIAMDVSFWNLYLSTFKNKHISHVCADAEKNIPLRDKILTNIFINDAFHFFLKKNVIAREIDRILDDAGFVSISHVHSTRIKDDQFSKPISPDIFAKLFSNLNTYIIPENILHKNVFLQNQKLVLSQFLFPQNSVKDVHPKKIPAYVSFLFKKLPQSKYLYFDIGKYDVELPLKLDYSEDPWLQKN